MVSEDEDKMACQPTIPVSILTRKKMRVFVNCLLISVPSDQRTLTIDHVFKNSGVCVPMGFQEFILTGGIIESQPTKKEN